MIHYYPPLSIHDSLMTTEEEHRIEREQIKKEREEMIEQENCISDLKKQIQDCQRDLDQQV